MKLKIEAIRKQMGLTQEEIAKELGITSTSYSLKEKKKREFKGSELVKISNMSGIAIDDMDIV